MSKSRDLQPQQKIEFISIPSTGKCFGNNRTVPSIYYKRPSFSERDLSAIWKETVLFSNCSSPISPSPQILSKTTDLRIKENLFVTRSEGGTAMVDSKSQTKQQQVTIDLKTSNVDNIWCFNERLGAFCWGNKTGSPWSNLGTREHTPTESSKVCHNDIYNKSQLNGPPLSFNSLFGHAWAYHQFIALTTM